MRIDSPENLPGRYKERRRKCILLYFLANTWIFILLLIVGFTQGMFVAVPLSSLALFLRLRAIERERRARMDQFEQSCIFQGTGEFDFPQETGEGLEYGQDEENPRDGGEEGAGEGQGQAEGGPEGGRGAGAIRGAGARRIRNNPFVDDLTLINILRSHGVRGSEGLRFNIHPSRANQVREV